MTQKRKSLFPLFIGLTALVVLIYQYGETWARHLLLYLSTAQWARSLVTRSAMAWHVASRFVAGEEIDDAITTTKQLNAQGMHVTLDYLGENVTRATDAIDARNHIIQLLEKIHETGVDATVSIKLSQIGMHIDPDLMKQNATALLQTAQKYNNRIRLDMEESSTVDKTLDLYHSLRYQQGFENVGVVIQSYLFRSLEDVKKLIQEGASVRLCKGAYAEPADIAFPHKADTDANFVRLTQLMLSAEARQKGVYLGVATHDEQMIQATIDYVTNQQISADDFEFQMLFGVRRDLQEELVSKGYQMRVYVPFGTAWYPYFVRRLAERPANLWFFISNFIRR